MTVRRGGAAARAKNFREIKSGELRYFSDELIEANLLLIVVPSVFTAAMMASAMPAAISPYSIAVAPELVGQERPDELNSAHLWAPSLTRNFDRSILAATG